MLLSSLTVYMTELHQEAYYFKAREVREKKNKGRTEIKLKYYILSYLTENNVVTCLAKTLLIKIINLFATRKTKQNNPVNYF